MRAITVIALLTALMGLAIANGASNLMTTLIAIPLGATAGAGAVFAIWDRLPQRRRRRSGRAEASKVDNVITLHPRSVPQLALPAPEPLRLAA